MGHNYMGHNYIGHNYIGHNYVGHNHLQSQLEAALMRPDTRATDEGTQRGMAVAMSGCVDVGPLMPCLSSYGLYSHGQVCGRGTVDAIGGQCEDVGLGPTAVATQGHNYIGYS